MRQFQFTAPVRFLAGLVTAATLAMPQPARATNVEFTELNCATSPVQGQDYGDLVFHFKKLEIDDDEGDPGDNFEFWFDVGVSVFEADPAKPDWSGPQVCSFDIPRWSENLPQLNIFYGGMQVYGISKMLTIHNVPVNSRAVLHMRLLEEDSTSGWDVGDFNPYGGFPDFLVNAYPYTRNGVVGIDWATTNRNIAFNKQKRVVGDGEGMGDFAAGIEFVVNMHGVKTHGGAGYTPNLPSIGQPLTPLPGQKLATKETTCRAYALKAVEDNVAADTLGCGFKPPVWSNEHQMHFDWCMVGNNVNLAQTETQNRAAALDACKKAKSGSVKPPQGNQMCELYANEALKTAAKADARGCGFAGPRWIQDYNAHLNFCNSNPGPVLLLAEHAMRDVAYQNCIAKTAELLTPDWIFHNSHVRYLSNAEVSVLNKDQLWQARNEIFARKGMIFTTQKAKDFFAKKAWYQPLHHTVLLIPFEKANVALIQSYE